MKLVSNHSTRVLAKVIDLLITLDEFSLETKRDNVQPQLTIVIATATLQHILLDLLNNPLMRVADTGEGNLTFGKSLPFSHWYLTVHSCETKLVEKIFTIQNLVEKKITVKGSLLNAFQLNGCYHQGLITCECRGIQNFISKFLNCVVNEQLSISPLGSLKDLEISTKTDPKSTWSQNKSITLMYSESQVSAILGIGGHKLNSIRFQSKCWIYVLPVSGFRKPRTQRIQISGTVDNIAIAVYEINRIVSGK